MNPDHDVSSSRQPPTPLSRTGPELIARLGSLQYLSLPHLPLADMQSPGGGRLTAWEQGSSRRDARHRSRGSATLDGIKVKVSSRPFLSFHPMFLSLTSYTPASARTRALVDLRIKLPGVPPFLLLPLFIFALHSNSVFLLLPFTLAFVRGVALPPERTRKGSHLPRVDPQSRDRPWDAYLAFS